MTIVDTHCHIGLHKYEPVESLIFQMDRNGVGKAVLIQYMGNPDNAYIVETLERYPGRFSATMIVEAEDDGARVRRWAEQGIPGIRLPADSRARCADPLAQWRAAADLDLAVSVPCSPDLLVADAFQEVVRTFPDLRIVLEHLCGVGRDEKPPYDAYRQALRLSDHANITLKLPGFGEFCEMPHPFSDVPPLADMALEAFGPQRMMWGSDFPPVCSREGYANGLSFPMGYLDSLSQDEKAWIFGRTAMDVWGFRAG
ncbi:MAG: amidohydrolase family protein [Acidobacteriota bacterium]